MNSETGVRFHVFVVLFLFVGTILVVALLLSSESFVDDDGIFVVAFDGGGGGRMVVVSVENESVWCVCWGVGIC